MGLFDKLNGPVFLKEDSEAEKQLAVLKSLPQTPEIEQEIKLVEAGIYGEKQIRFELENSHIPMYVIHDLFLEHNGLTAQIDYLIICHKCQYVIECKNLYGNIEIDSNGNFIRNFNYGKYYKKEGIYSPVTQNQRHLELIRQIIADRSWVKKFAVQVGFEDLWKSAVVLSNPRTVLNDKKAPKNIKNQVLRADQLISFIKKCESESKEMSSSESAMKETAESWLADNKPNKVDYTEKFKAQIAQSQAQEEAAQSAQGTLAGSSKKAVTGAGQGAQGTLAGSSEKAMTGVQKDAQGTLTGSSEKAMTGKQKDAQTTPAPICERCGAPMVKRKATKGAHVGEEFWGCSKFPKCRYTISIDK